MDSSQFQIALNAAGAPAENIFALNAEIPIGDDGDLPEWVQLMPPGEEVNGRDGRKWINDNPEGILSAFNNEFHPIPIGWGHKIDVAGLDEAPPAAAWIEELEARDDGSVWGRVAWNSWGGNSVKSREYRFLSPSFLFEKKTLRVLQLVGAGLTNNPNLPHLGALNSKNATRVEDSMDKELLKALGLTETATLEDVIKAVNQMKTAVAANSAQPSLDKYVPRADYDAAVEKATNSEKALAERETAGLEKDIETAINAALEAKKITPATADYHKAQCRAEGGLERFQDFIKAAPEVAPDSGLGEKTPEGGDGGKLTPAELAVCQATGLSEKDFLEARA